MFYEVSTEVMEEVESQLGELNGEAFQTTMTDFWTAVQELQGSQQLRHAGTDRTESIRIRAESKCGICWLKFLSGQPEYTDQTECG